MISYKNGVTMGLYFIEAKRRIYASINKTIICSDNGLSSDRRQTIIWTNAGILLIGPLGTHCNEILIEIHIFSIKKMHLKMSSGKCRLLCLGLNMLTDPFARSHAKIRRVPAFVEYGCAVQYYLIWPEVNLTEWARICVSTLCGYNHVVNDKHYEARGRRYSYIWHEIIRNRNWISKVSR